MRLLKKKNFYVEIKDNVNFSMQNVLLIMNQNY